MKKLKVLHVVGAMNMGGTETMLMNVFRSINRNEIQFDFVSYSSNKAYYDDEILKLGGRIFHLNKTTSVKQLMKVIKENGPYDVIHSHTLFHCGIANLAGKLAGIPVRIAHAHTTLDNQSSVIRRTYINLMRQVIHFSSTNLLSCSQEAGKYLFGDNKRYLYLPNLIDYSKFMMIDKVTVSSFKKQYHLENRYVIGHIGRFTEAKNHIFMINLMEKIVQINSNAYLVLVGEGSLKTDIEFLVKEKNLENHVLFLGLREDISTILHCFDVFLFPSIFEGLGLVLLEAQMCGVPCIVSEAIQPEADLGLGLMSQLRLTDNLDLWCEQVLNRSSSKLDDSQSLISALYEKGYTKEQVVGNLMNIYKGEYV